MKVDDSVRVRVSNANTDDFVRGLVTLLAENDVTGVSWSLPDRLATRPDLMDGIMSELLAELEERTDRARSALERDRVG